jgi:hypothetical protein
MKDAFLWSYRFFFSLRQRRIGPVVCRVLFSLWLLTFFVQGLPDASFLWSSGGVVTQDIYLAHLQTTGEFSIFTFGRSTLFVTIAALVGALLSLAALVGVLPRLAFGLLIPILWSFHSVNPHILDGGDNLGRMALFVMPLLLCTHHEFKSAQSGTAWALLHNFARTAVALQLASLYFVSGWDKLAGGTWQNGTALYYVFQSNQFSAPWLPGWFKSSALLLTAMSLMVVVSQISFAFLAPVRKARIIICLALIGMHVGIAMTMGLVRFSLVMIAVLALLVPDSTYIRLVPRLKVFVRRSQDLESRATSA